MQSHTPLQYVKGVGPKLKKPLDRLGLYTVYDCLYLFPRQYEDRRHLPRLINLQVGKIQTVVVLIEKIEEKKIKKGLSILECHIADQSGRGIATWFNQPFLKKVLKPYTQLLIKGKVDRTLFKDGVQIKVSETEVLRTAADIKEAIGKIIPKYSLTNGLYQHQMRAILKEILDTKIFFVEENFSDELRDKLNLFTIRQALTQLHRPEDEGSYQKAKYRIVFEEFLYYQLQLGRKRLLHDMEAIAEPLLTMSEYVDVYLNTVPYSLTKAQNRAIEDVKKDIQKKIPMNRLLQGDVGSGKTDVAIIALLLAVSSQKTGAIMAPTEILAMQHYIKLSRLLSSLNIDVVLLKGKMKVKEKREALTHIQSKPCIVVGTHALIQDTVLFHELGLVVIDEQHKFGVMQRLKLKKEISPHCLFMTATPIPRTFMLTAFGDLDKSIIDELPPGRLPAKTFFIKGDNAEKAYEKCRESLQLGRQLYVVFPLVEESEKLDLISAEEGFESIKDIYPDFKVGIIHGRLKSDEKTAVMAAFKKGETDILVATTVIEVGLDVPNATMMIIHHAERFGLSQLHQLRGRIGRGTQQSECFLIGVPKTDNGIKRIKAMVETTDGFKLAEYDLQIRGPGDMLGTRQAGLPDFHLGDIVRDEKILIIARHVATALLKEDPLLSDSKHAKIRTHLDGIKNRLMEDALN